MALTETIDGASPAYRRCANLYTPAACNWLLFDHGVGAREGLCVACRLNRTIPNLSIPENGVLWGRFEQAKRQMVSTLLALEIPVASKEEYPEKGLSFDFLRNPENGPRVLTGHSNGVITMNIEEADPAIREGIREKLNEPYRTLLGHFRHEVGHYYWERLIWDTPWLDEFRQLFGDERADYSESMARNYKEGPPADWHQRFVSSYASSHPWEDWAETWAHLLHMADTLRTALSFGLDPGQLDLEIEPYTKEALYRPDEPNAMRFLGFLQFMDRVKRRDERNVEGHGIAGFLSIRAAVSCRKEIALHHCCDSHGAGSVSQEGRRVKNLKVHRSVNHQYRRMLL